MLAHLLSFAFYYIMMAEKNGLPEFITWKEPARQVGEGREQGW
jgi:hypothetical protein